MERPTVDLETIQVEMTEEELRLLQAAATIKGVSVEDFILDATMKKVASMDRLQDVKNAYFNASEIDEFSDISDGISEFCEIDNATPLQIKSVFDLLGESIIGRGISFGFDDTEVRDEIYAFMDANKIAINKAVHAAS